MAEQVSTAGLDVATCRHCSQPKARQPHAWWTHTTGSRHARCAPYTRNASMADPVGGWRRHD